MGETISVIVPVYKVEKYLNKCVESIVNQTYRNLEIILVDDGSPDNCPALCDEWAKKDERIKVVHIENGGAGNARNVAIDMISGEYVSFVDSDDYLDENMFRLLMSQLNEPVDVVECGYIVVEGDCVDFDNNIEPKNAKCYTSEEALLEHIKNRRFQQVIWNKIYRKKVVANVYFPVGRKIDDEFWAYRVIGNSKKLVCLENQLYAYRQQPDSVMHTSSVRQQCEAIEAKCERHQYICEKYPVLKDDSSMSVWFTCLYHAQKALLQKGSGDDVLTYVKKTLKDYPVYFPKTASTKEKAWLGLMKISVVFAGRIRNLLGIGL